jgi:molybdopterin molybdotransferase
MVVGAGAGLLRFRHGFSAPGLARSLSPDMVSMNDFFPLKSPMESVSLISGLTPLALEMVPLTMARGRVLAEDMISSEALPPFSRSTMDGFAVRSDETSGCSELEPVLFSLTDAIDMGSSGQALRLQPGQAAPIATGGELPEMADAVVMVEATQARERGVVAIYRAVTAGENVIDAGEDYVPGAVVLGAGSRLRPQDLGVLAGLGMVSVPVHRRPRVAILSTGDELVRADQTPSPGKIRDINSTTLAALVEEAGGIAIAHGICGDDFEGILALCTEALQGADVLLLSGGSSRGRRDFTHQVFSAIPQGQMLTSSVSLRPAKPAILARQGNKALIGLPGPAASAMGIFYSSVRPLLRYYSGLGATMGMSSVRAVTAHPFSRFNGREEYVHVTLSPRQDGTPPLATAVYGKSGLLSPLVRADGLLPMGGRTEGVGRGVEVSVLLFP